MPAERRAHRRFTFEQLHVAMLLNALRSLGANIAVLRAFSSLLQDGLAVVAAAAIDPSAMRAAITLRSQLTKFDSGEQVPVSLSEDDVYQRHSATCASQIVQSWLWREKNEGADPTLAGLAQSFSQAEAECAGWALSLTDSGHLELEDHESAWVGWVDPDGKARLAFEDEDLLKSDDGPLAAFYIPVTKLIRRLWPERIGPAREQYRIDRHNHEIRRLIDLEEKDPQAASDYRRRNSIPDDWAEHYRVIEGGAEMGT